MPRTARAAVGGVCYHVLNRGNGRVRVFHDEEDYFAFVDLLVAANERLPARPLGFCLMPNHFHLILWPRADGDLGRWMQWLLTSHVRRHHRRRRGSGHVWQGRFKAFPIQRDDHFLTVMRYVERSAVRAGLVSRAERWRWSSAWAGRPQHPVGLVDVWPVDRPRNWVQRLNQPETEAELAAVRQSMNRGAPFGDEAWRVRTATRLGLEASLNPRGRPRKEAAQ